MYMSGFSTMLPGTGILPMSGLAGTQLCCYTGWEANGGAGTGPVYTIDLPLIGVPSNYTNATMSWDITGTMLATVEYQGGFVSLWNASANTIGTGLNAIPPGGLITQFYPDDGMETTGAIDGENNLHAYQRANGEYIFTLEDDGADQVLIYRWNPWIDLEIGSGSGGYTYNATSCTWTITETGIGIGGGADGFHYIYRGMTGNGTVIANLGALNCATSSAQAGVMIRNDLTTTAEDAAGMGETATGNTLGYWWRLTTGGTGAKSTTTGTPPTWFEVTRLGNNFNTYNGTDGVNWTQVGVTKTIAMNTEVYVGLPVSSSSTIHTATATISNVTTTP
jgi:hypothetical protein